jgi:GR25 family glycosyltransferase involved in LPS biosynthesis
MDHKMLETLASNFLIEYDMATSVNICRYLRSNNCLNLCVLFGNYFLKVQGSSNTDLLDELGICYYYMENYNLSYETYHNAISKFNSISEDKIKRFVFNQKFAADKICERYIYYDKNIVDYITSLNRSENLITFSMTTCKRMDLFKKTMNSFLNCVTDLHLIKEWIVVDDQSSDEDISEMRRLYPFLKIVRKTKQEKGHIKSMNIIKDMVTTPYLFHMEDDWMIYLKDNHLTKCLDVLNSSQKYGQCLLNLNYSELPMEDICGGFFKRTELGTPYYEHEHHPYSLPEKFIGKPNSAYWPHYSLRPSLLKTKIFRDLGDFNLNSSHFEMEYAYKYKEAGYISCFMPYTCSKHIGRLTSERFDKTKANAYELNGELQFTNTNNIDSNTRIKNYVVNLDRRPDRWENFMKISTESNIPLKFERFSAVDGKALIPTRQMLQIFDNNDYSYRRGIVGCALSHIKLMIQLLNDNDSDAYLILEDDITFTPNFYQKYAYIFSQIKNRDWDLLYLGSFYYPQYCNIAYNKDMKPFLEKLTADESLRKCIGGTFGYLINKKGCKKVLEYITDMGMTNAIDTMQQKSGNRANIYYSMPNLVFSEIASGNTDIQYNYDNLYVSPKDRITEEEKLLENRGVKYVITDTDTGGGWWIDKKYITVSEDDQEKVRDIMYKDRLKKFSKEKGDYVYDISDCLYNDL